MEVDLDLAPQVVEHLWRVAVVAAQARPAARRVEIGFVDLHLGFRQPVQAGHVVLVHMAQDHQVRRVECRADVVGHLGCVEGHQRVAAAHDHLVAVGVLA